MRADSAGRRDGTIGNRILFFCNASMRPNLGDIGLSMAWGTHDSIFMVCGGIGDLVISTELSRNASMRPNAGGIRLSIA